VPRVEVDLHIDAAPAQSWAAVVDVESYSQCMENVQSVKIIDQDGPDRRSTAWSVYLKGSVLEWVEAEQLDHRSYRFDFHQLSGDLAHFIGHWAVRPGHGGGSIVSLHVEFEIGIPLLADMLNPVASAALRDNARQMLAALDERLTGSSPP
jgi:ribosome-associated toxin RatA of RatAB toxin-antitoxin module